MIGLTENEILERALKRSAIFEGLTAEQARAIPGWFTKEFKRGELISECQNGVYCVGLMIKGSAEVSPNCQSSVSILSGGGEFGICNIFVSEDMPTVLVAKTSCKVGFIPKDNFAQLLGTDSVLMYRYVRLCNRKMIYLAEKLRMLSIPDALGRLAFWLVRSDDFPDVRLNMTKDDLAKRLGISRASLFRAIASLEKEGIIRSVGDRILITEPEAEVFKSAKYLPRIFPEE